LGCLLEFAEPPDPFAVADPGWDRLSADADRRGRVLLFWLYVLPYGELYVLPYGEIRLDLTRHPGLTTARTMAGAGDG
jgi:hypothetical protein